MKKKSKDDELVKNKVNKKSSKGKFARYAFYYLCFFGIFLAIFTSLSLTAFFKIEQIFVSGNNKYEESDIIAVSDINIGSNLFRLNDKEIEQKLIDSFVYIEDVNIKRQFPPSIILEIHQAEPFATLKAEDKYLLVSDKGIVLEELDKPYSRSMPVVLGLEPAAINKELVVATKMDDSKDKTHLTGSKVTPSQQESISMLNALVKALETTGFKDVTAIDLSSVLNIVIVYQDRIIIELGSQHDLEYKLNFIKQTAEYNQENFEGVIDATITKQLRVRKADIRSLLDTDYNVSIVEVNNIPSSVANLSNNKNAQTSSSQPVDNKDENSQNQSSEQNSEGSSSQESQENSSQQSQGSSSQQSEVNSNSVSQNSSDVLDAAPIS